MRLINPKSRKVSLPAKTAVAFFGAVVFLSPIFSFAYTFKAGVLVEPETYQNLNEDISQRTENSQTFIDGNKRILKLYSGQQFIKETDGWKSADILFTPEETAENQTKETNLLIEMENLFLIPQAEALLNTTSTNNKDTMVVENAPTTNYGTQTTFNVYNYTGAKQRGLINFSLPYSSATSTEIIESIKLFLYNSVDAYNTTPFNFNYQVQEINSSWTETGVNWNNKPTTTGLNIDDKAVASDTNIGWKWWWLQGNQNYANRLNKSWGENIDLELSPDNTGSGSNYMNETFASKENGTSSIRPYLEIIYSVQAESATSTSSSTESEATQQYSYFKMFVLDIGIILGTAFLIFKFLA